MNRDRNHKLGIYTIKPSDLNHADPTMQSLRLGLPITSEPRKTRHTNAYRQKTEF
jgi:hypothetical protein